jgi:hypothetical protein
MQSSKEAVKMIFNNLGTMTIENTQHGNQITFSSDLAQTVDYSIVSSDGRKTSGEVPFAQYVELIPAGEQPYSVQMGFGDYSISVTQEGVQTTDLVSFIMINPISSTGTGAHIFVSST